MPTSKRSKKRSKKSGWKQSVPRGLGSVRKGIQGGSQAVYKFTREITHVVDLPNSTAGNIERVDGTAGGGLSIQLTANNITDFGVDFPALFAGYKFDAIEYTFRVGRTEATGAAGSPQILLHSFNNEFNSVGNIVTQAQLDQMQSKKTQAMVRSDGRPVRVKFKPTQQVTVASTNALADARAIGNAGWIPTGELGVIHSGPCIVIQTADQTLFLHSATHLRITVKFWISCKSVQ